MNRIKFDSLIREIDEKNNPLYLEVYKYHADVNQLYGDLPYSFHLNMVKNIVNQYSYDYLEAVRFTNEDTIKSELNTLQISAIEHDLIEDTRLNYTQVYELNNRFLNDPIESSRITEIVYALTDEKGEFIIGQIYKKYDANVTQETRDYFNNWIKSENMQKFLETNYLVTEPKENVTGHITNIMSDLNKKAI